jgi:hypothetical protein
MFQWRLSRDSIPIAAEHTTASTWPQRVTLTLAAIAQRRYKGEG